MPFGDLASWHDELWLGDPGERLPQPWDGEAAVGEVAGDGLADMVRSYLDDDEVALIPEDPAREVRANTWRYGVPAGPVIVSSVVEALGFVADQLRLRLAEHAGSGTFYCWYDEQAGQLRCSLSSAPPDRLPFRAPYYVAPDAAEVVGLAAVDPHPGFIAWEELNETNDPGSTTVPDPAPFPVWAVVVR